MIFNATNLNNVLGAFGMQKYGSVFNNGAKGAANITDFFEGGTFNRELFEKSESFSGLDTNSKKNLGDALDFGFGKNSKNYTNEALANAGEAYRRNGEVGLGTFATPTHSSSLLMETMGNNIAGAAFGGAAIGGITGAAMGNDPGESAVFGGLAGVAMFGLGRGLRSGAFMESVEKRAISSIMGKSHDELIADKQAVYRGRLEGEVERNREIVQRETQKSMNNEEKERLIRQQGTPEQKLVDEEGKAFNQKRETDRNQFVGIDRRTNQPVTKADYERMPEDEASNIFKVDINAKKDTAELDKNTGKFYHPNKTEEELRKEYLTERQLSESFSESEKEAISEVRKSLTPEELARFDEQVYQNTEKQLSPGSLEDLMNPDGGFSFPSNPQDSSFSKIVNDNTLKNQLDNINPIELPSIRNEINQEFNSNPVLRSKNPSEEKEAKRQLLERIDATIEGNGFQPITAKDTDSVIVDLIPTLKTATSFSEAFQKAEKQPIEEHVVRDLDSSGSTEMNFDDKTMLEQNTSAADKTLLQRQAALDFKLKEKTPYEKLSLDEQSKIEKELYDEHMSKYESNLNEYESKKPSFDQSKENDKGYIEQYNKEFEEWKTKRPEISNFNPKQLYDQKYEQQINPRQALNKAYNSEFDTIIQSQKAAKEAEERYQKTASSMNLDPTKIDSGMDTVVGLKKLDENGRVLPSIKLDYEKYPEQRELRSGSGLNRFNSENPQGGRDLINERNAEYEATQNQVEQNINERGLTGEVSREDRMNLIKKSLAHNQEFNRTRLEGPHEIQSIEFVNNGQTTRKLNDNETLIPIENSNYSFVGEKSDLNLSASAAIRMFDAQNVLRPKNFDNVSRPLANKELLQEAATAPTTSFMGKQAQKLLRSGPDHNIGMQTRHMVLGGSMLAGAAFGSKRKDHSRGFNSHRGNRI